MDTKLLHVSQVEVSTGLPDEVVDPILVALFALAIDSEAEAINSRHTGRLRIAIP